MYNIIAQVRIRGWWQFKGELAGLLAEAGGHDPSVGYGGIVGAWTRDRVLTVEVKLLAEDHRTAVWLRLRHSAG